MDAYLFALLVDHWLLVGWVAWVVAGSSSSFGSVVYPSIVQPQAVESESVAFQYTKSECERGSIQTACPLLSFPPSLASLVSP